MTAQNKTIRLAINGFGRTGRAAYKIALEHKNVDVVAINDLSNPRVLAHSLKYDTAYGIYPNEVYIEEDEKKVRLETAKGDQAFFTKTGTKNYLVVDGARKTQLFSEKEPQNLPWDMLKIDVVLECTGRFVKDDAANAHITAGAKHVVISAPAKGGTARTFLLGANHEKYKDEKLVSNASCTTNCISPVISALSKKFSIKKAGLTTIHSVTSSQNIVDSAPNPRKPDLRRSRAGSWNLIPTTTGAAKATTQIIPNLQDHFDGIAIRAPIITGSLADLTMLVENKTTVEDINNALIEASKQDYYKKFLAVTYEPIVSSDIIGNPFSATVDLSMTRVIDGDLVKILAWYDNEWGYSNRLVELAIHIASKKS